MTSPKGEHLRGLQTDFAHALRSVRVSINSTVIKLPTAFSSEEQLDLVSQFLPLFATFNKLPNDSLLYLVRYHVGFGLLLRGTGGGAGVLPFHSCFFGGGGGGGFLCVA